MHLTVAASSRASDQEGASLAELLIALTIVGLIGALAVPATVTATDEARVRQAAAFMAGRMRLARQDAIFRRTSSALVFDEVSTKWVFRVCVDGNGNGFRRAEMATGVDRCTEGPIDLSVTFPGVTVGVDPTLPGPDHEAGSADPVRLGASNVASFSPMGTCTSGSVFLRSAAGEQFVIRIAGVNARTRVLMFDRYTRTWRQE